MYSLPICHAKFGYSCKFTVYCTIMYNVCNYWIVHTNNSKWRNKSEQRTRVATCNSISPISLKSNSALLVIPPFSYITSIHTVHYFITMSHSSTDTDTDTNALHSTSTQYGSMRKKCRYLCTSVHSVTSAWRGETDLRVCMCRHTYDNYPQLKLD